LISMEENGYDSKPMRDTRNKLNRLIVSYDFLKEYAYGNEQVDDQSLNDLLKITGSYNMSNKSGSTIVQSTRDSMDINEVGGCLDFIRIYVNDEISTSEVLTPTSVPTTLKIYGSNSVESISVTITVTGTLPVTYTGVNYVTIRDIILDETDGIVLDITTTNVCGVTSIYKYEYIVQDVSCSSVTYWVGSTSERFKISVSNLNESSNLLTYNPNTGTNSGGTTLTYDWVTTHAEMLEFVYRENVTQRVEALIGDSHVLLFIPVTLEVTDVKEVVLGTPVDMEYGTNYYTFPVTSPTLKQYNCVYFRDLTNLTFPDVSLNATPVNRIFQFNINKV